MCIRDSINYEGKAGNGQHTKMCNQIAIAGALSGACEALAYANAVGLDPQTMLDSISTGAAGSAQMSNVATRILKGDLQPGFFVKHFIKDMKLADEEALAEQDVYKRRTTFRWVRQSMNWSCLWQMIPTMCF